MNNKSSSVIGEKVSADFFISHSIERLFCLQVGSGLERGVRVIKRGCRLALDVSLFRFNVQRHIFDANRIHK